MKQPGNRVGDYGAGRGSGRGQSVKRTALKRHTPLLARTAMKRTPLRKRSAKQGRRDRELAKSKVVVMERSGGKCEVPGCGRLAVHVHHKRLRSQGGTHGTENLMALCAKHHDRAHRHPAEAAAAGIIDRRTDPDPDQTAAGLAQVNFDATTFCRAIGTSP